MATNYSRGRAFEYRTRDACYKRGAKFVIRAAQSKGKADLAVFWKTQYVAGSGPQPVLAPWLVQCKTGSARMSPMEKVELLDLARDTGTTPVIAEPGPKGRGVVFKDLRTMEVL